MTTPELLQKRVLEILLAGKPKLAAELRLALPGIEQYDLLYALLKLQRMERVIQGPDGRWEGLC